VTKNCRRDPESDRGRSQVSGRLLFVPGPVLVPDIVLSRLLAFYVSTADRVLTWGHGNKIQAKLGEKGDAIVESLESKS
jgi:hypothetical protein